MKYNETMLRFHHEDEEHHHHHHDCGGNCENCDPMTETLALMDYMIKHNAAHASELAQLGKKLDELGKHEASEQVQSAVSEFEKANMRLSVILASLK